MDTKVEDEKQVRCPWCWWFDGIEVLRYYGVACQRCGKALTCEQCEDNDCPYWGDLYNSDGACLMSK